MVLGHKNKNNVGIWGPQYDAINCEENFDFDGPKLTI